MKIFEVISHLETLAPPSYQETYDNSGLLTGNTNLECTGIICTLDATETVIIEAMQNGCNLVVAHHPIIFSGLKKITGKNYVERTIISAIKNDIAIYAIHTNLDNVLVGVNGQIADKLGLIKTKVLVPTQNNLKKLAVFVPIDYAEKVRSAIFDAGGGCLGNYSQCSFSMEGTGTFKPGEGAMPYVGEAGTRHQENETRIEVIFPAYLQQSIIQAATNAHPYEVMAYDIYELANIETGTGSGLIGELLGPMEELDLLKHIKEVFGLCVIRHTPLTGNKIKKVAVCGGAGSFLIKPAIAVGANIIITADVKYHEFFDAEDKIVIADIGHWESEQFTITLLHDVLAAKFPTFAVQKSEVITNPVRYFI